MAYSKAIPNATDRPNNSQPLIKANFTAIDTVVKVNHVEFDDPSGDQGKHKFVTMPVQVATPPVGAFAAGEVGFYSFNDPKTLKNEIYINKTNQTTVTQIPATSSSLSKVSAPASNTVGWSMLPSGILIKWGYGTVTATPTGIHTVTYDTSVTFGAVFSITLTSTHGGGDNNHLLTVYSSSTGSFELKSTLATAPGTPAATGYYYFSVGRPA